MKFTSLIDSLGEPALITERNAATRPEHWCIWLCGCLAVNLRGLCLPSGWKLQCCPAHDGLAPSSTATTVVTAGRP